MGADFPYLYPHSRTEARRCEELDKWETSHQLNIDCRKAIESAVSAGFDGEHLNESCAQGIIEQYGFLRTNYVLANTLQRLRRNEQVSSENSRWGERIFIPPEAARNREFAVQCHPGALNEFVTQARQAYQELGLFGSEHCIGKRHSLDYTGKVLVMRPDTLRESCWSPRNQLWLAEGGFGCSPTASGRAVYATCLGDGEQSHWDRADFIGVLDEQYLPDWAAEKLDELRGSQQKQSGPVMGGMN